MLQGVLIYEFKSGQCYVDALFAIVNTQFFSIHLFRNTFKVVKYTHAFVNFRKQIIELTQC